MHAYPTEITFRDIFSSSLREFIVLHIVRRTQGMVRCKTEKVKAFCANHYAGFGAITEPSVLRPVLPPRGGNAMHIEPVPGSPPTVPPIPPDIVPPVKEPEPDRLPDEEPLPNPDENDRPVKWNRAPRDHPAAGRSFSPCTCPPIRLHARHPQVRSRPALTRGRLAQLVERFVYTEDVGSSSLSSPTISHAPNVPDGSQC